MIQHFLFFIKKNFKIKTHKKENRHKVTANNSIILILGGVNGENKRFVVFISGDLPTG